MTKVYILLLILFSTSIASANYYSCSDYQNINGHIACDKEFNGPQEEVCEVCREGKSCFSAIDNRKQRGLCQAYIEGRSCFMALGSSDRRWCQVILEEGSCRHLRSDVDRFKCRHGEYPSSHTFWIY